MPALVDLTNKRFGRLLILRKEKSHKRHTTWLTICDCGNYKSIIGYNIKSGKSKSCGCLTIERTKEAKRLAPSIAGFNALVRDYKKSADKRGYIFGLTEQQFRQLVSQPCFYCGQEPIQIQTKKETRRSEEAQLHSRFIYNGIDRFNNNEGYILDNCRPCCKGCNLMKMNLNGDVFLKQIERIHRHVTR